MSPISDVGDEAPQTYKAEAEASDWDDEEAIMEVFQSALS